MGGGGIPNVAPSRQSLWEGLGLRKCRDRSGTRGHGSPQESVLLEETPSSQTAPECSKATAFPSEQRTAGGFSGQRTGSLTAMPAGNQHQSKTLEQRLPLSTRFISGSTGTPVIAEDPKGQMRERGKHCPTATLSFPCPTVAHTVACLPYAVSLGFSFPPPRGLFAQQSPSSGSEGQH